MGETATDGAFTTLRTYVGQVRRRLAAIGPGEVLVTRGGGYALLVDPSDVDAEVFDRLVHRGQEALALGGDPGRARASLAAALDLWRGDVLADLGTPAYAEAFSAGLHERRADAWEALMDSELALGRHPEVVATLRSLVTTYPYRERFTAQLVLALYRCGRQADALMAYNATKHRLADELGLDPSPELRDLQSAVLRQDPLLACAPSTPRPHVGRPEPTDGHVARRRPGGTATHHHGGAGPAAGPAGPGMAHDVPRRFGDRPNLGVRRGRQEPPDGRAGR